MCGGKGLLAQPPLARELGAQAVLCPASWSQTLVAPSSWSCLFPSLLALPMLPFFPRDQGAGTERLASLTSRVTLGKSLNVPEP